ncbi:MAG: protein kinase [archaeon]|nr:protein kinase [archaeon]
MPRSCSVPASSAAGSEELSDGALRLGGSQQREREPGRVQERDCDRDREREKELRRERDRDREREQKGLVPEPTVEITRSPSLLQRWPSAPEDDKQDGTGIKRQSRRKRSSSEDCVKIAPPEAHQSLIINMSDSNSLKPSSSSSSSSRISSSSSSSSSVRDSRSHHLAAPTPPPLNISSYDPLETSEGDESDDTWYHRRRRHAQLHYRDETLMKSSTCKVAIEKYYDELFFWLASRKHRRRELLTEMKRQNLPSGEIQECLGKLEARESQVLRARRLRVDQSSFETLRVIGRGGFGEVRLVRMLETGQVFAMKVMRKRKLIKKKQEIYVCSERNALADNSAAYRQNPWVVKLYYSFQDDEYLYLVMEYIPGGDMMHLLIELDVFPEELARFFIAELVLAIQSIHDLDYIHRDLKPDNILVDRDGHIKLSDFGLCTGLKRRFDLEDHMKKKAAVLKRGSKHGPSSSSSLSASAASSSSSSGNPPPPGCSSDDDDGERFESDSFDSFSSSDSWTLKPFHDRTQRFTSWKKKRRKLAFSAVGTPDYIAPEVLQQVGYGKEADWWSVGVIMFEMLAGGAPFSADSADQTRRNVLNSSKILAQGWQAEELDKMDPTARDLILKLMCPADVRLGIDGSEAIKAHPFFKGICWDELRQTTALLIPQLSSPTDSRNFPDEEIISASESDSDDDHSSSSSFNSSSSDLDYSDSDGAHPALAHRSSISRSDRRGLPAAKRFPMFTYRSFAALEERFEPIEEFIKR